MEKEKKAAPAKGNQTKKSKKKSEQYRQWNYVCVHIWMHFGLTSVGA